MPIEKMPRNPLPANYVSPGGIPYKVGNEDSWSSLAVKLGIDVWRLIEFNFKTRDPDEVNWYLRRNVGCKKQTPDGKNWMFSAAASPGIIYLPPGKTTTVVKAAPTKVCPEELNAAQATLRRSQEIAESILGRGATSDMPYWFARLYQYITLYEIQDQGMLSHPCFLLHFIPIFYDSYAVAVEAFKSKGSIPPHWQDHFNMASLIVDPSQLMPWVNAVTKSLISGITAHIQKDMAQSLEKAYRTFSAKYTGVPPFDTFYHDFFDRNRPVFVKVRLAIVNELVNRGMGLAAMGKSVDPNFASKGAEVVNMGLNIDEIFNWRKEAWREAKSKLRQ
jgi:hypothetical protein